MDILLQVAVQGVLFGGIYALMALALAIVYSITHQLNFAHGSLIVIGMYLSLLGSGLFGFGPYISAVAIAPIMFIGGFVLFRAIFAPMMSAPLLLVVQVTLALAIIIQSVLLIAFGSDYQTVSSSLTGIILTLGSVRLGSTSVLAFSVSVVLVLVSYYSLRHTEFGKRVSAVAEDSQAAALVGINVPLVQASVFAAAMAIMGIVGALIAPVIVFQPISGLHFTLISFIVFILGGVNNFIGTFIAGLIIGLAESLSALYIYPGIAPTIPYVIFVVFLIIRPNGVMERVS